MGTAKNGTLAFAWNIPRRLPDEILYSYLARIHAMSGTSSLRQTTRVLFNAPFVQLLSDLPTHLRQLWAIIARPADILNEDQLLHEMTLYDYYAHFLDGKARDRLRLGMLLGDYSVKAVLGLMASRIGASTVPRYCGTCVQEDIAAFGIAYWHRIHQLPCVSICVKHNMPLCVRTPSTARNCLELPSPTGYAAAGDGLALGSHTSPRSSERCFAVWSSAILARACDLTDVGNRQEFYLSTIRLRGFGAGSFNVHAEDFMHFVCDRQDNYQFLENRNQLDIGSIRSGRWIAKLYRHGRGTQHPLYHILLLSSLFKSPEEYLNSLKGFTLGRQAPIYLPSSTMRDSRTNVLLSHLRSTSTITAAARSAGVSVSTAVKIANLHDIAFVHRTKRLTTDRLKVIVNHLLAGMPCVAVASQSRVSLASVYCVLQSTPGLKDRVMKSRKQAEVARHRAQFKELVKAIHVISASDVRRLSPKLYAWFLRHDRDWLSARIKPAARQSHKYHAAPWASRDELLSTHIQLAAQGLLEKPQRPIHITVAELARRTGSSRWLPILLRKLPKTASVLHRYVETGMEFRARKMAWSYNQLSNLGATPRFWKAFRLASINHRFVEQMRVVFNTIEQRPGH